MEQKESGNSFAKKEKVDYKSVLAEIARLEELNEENVLALKSINEKHLEQ